MHNIIVNIDPRIDNFVKEYIEGEVKSLPEDTYSEKQVQSYINNFISSINVDVEIIKSKDIKSNVDKAKLLHDLLVNSCNKRSRKIFETISGKSLGKTIKDAESVFVAYFGNHLNELKEVEKQKESQKEQEEKEAVLIAEKKYYSSSIWDYEKISKMTPMQKGRLKKVIERLWRFDGVVKSMKKQIEHEWENKEIKDKYITNNMWKWDRRKYNQMMGDEQREYEAKLIKGRTYNYSLGDNSCRELPKTLFDVLNLEDTTDIDKLKQ